MMNVTNQWWKRGRVLGVGGFGFVFECRPLPNNPLSRLLPPIMAVKSSFNKESLNCEMQALSMFKDDHPHIIDYYGSEISTFRKEKGIYVPIYNIFLEYASGGDLFDKLKTGGGGGLPEMEVSRYVKEILLGLRDIHKLGLVHCDIKPDNVLFTGDGVAKIADFGLAMKGGMAEEMRGTPEYLSPEAITHRIYTWRCDIWALGCTVLQMLTGQNVWGELKFTNEMLSFVGQNDVVPAIPNGLSWEAIDFLQRCLVRDCMKRWSAESLLRHPFALGKTYLFALMKGIS